MIEFYNGVILVMKMTQESQGNYNEPEHRYIRGKGQIKIAMKSTCSCCYVLSSKPNYIDPNTYPLNL